MRRLGSWRIWIISAVAFVGFAGVFFASSAPFAIPQVEEVCGQTPLDVRFYSSGDDVIGFLDACGPGGREAYRNMQIADLLYPTIFGLFLASSLAMVITRLPARPSRPVWLAALPLLASAFDYLENAFAWSALTSYPDPSATGSLLGLASAAKTATSWASGIVLLVGLGILGMRLIQHRTPANPVDGSDHRPNDRQPASA